MWVQGGQDPLAKSGELPKEHLEVNLAHPLLRVRRPPPPLTHSRSHPHAITIIGMHDQTVCCVR
eukprot:COSAG01_NODE_10898_length_2056_cov_1.557486_3_plen_64_part_00